ncbi:potassium transporter Kup [Terrihabitans sp. PJ23]|uniref:Probable potassium transport system protein Kup n=2 Tax=Terrihabitans rhizophilus TaxID=3092662 RepID=A0ABU4RJX7_9HYPH|nr:potassium transporter Kup [Terrihabitans sp. PJ23]
MPTPTSADGHHPGGGAKWMLLLGSLGVVYGDIGTSPLYAMRESLLHAGDNPTDVEILGIVSLLIWALIIVVTLKYVVMMMRADNGGEGGTFSLLALAQSSLKTPSPVVLTLAIVGAALFYGDSILTPAISVLSAVEGLTTASPLPKSWVVPVTLVILTAVYVVQSYGTERVATFFGPIMLVWFAVLTILGVVHIFDAPEILWALSPTYALSFMFGHGIIGFTVLGSVFLAVTGAEALYADMGHFGRDPIRRAWLFCVLPALSLNYLGQGAMALTQPEAIENLFFLTAPEWARLPFVLLATLATVIAAQAVITGAYSLTRQAMMLGLLPRLEVTHTSETQHGQIYMPKINWLMLAGAILLVILFENSSALASAYGIAVVGTMFTTSFLAIVVIARVWKWGWWLAVLVMLPFIVIDTSFLIANLLKLFDGGYVPLLLGVVIAVMMWTWVRGTRILAEKVRKGSVPMVDLLKSLMKTSATRVPGTAIFLTSDPEVAPAAMLHNLKHNKVLHERNIIVTVRTLQRPYASPEERIKLEWMAEDFARLQICYGYMETPNIPKALAKAKSHGLKFDIMSTSFFIGRRSLRASAKEGMPLWQDNLYIGLSKQADDLIEYFRIPAGRVIELGSQVTL